MSLPTSSCNSVMSDILEREKADEASNEAVGEDAGPVTKTGGKAPRKALKVPKSGKAPKAPKAAKVAKAAKAAKAGKIVKKRGSAGCSSKHGGVKAKKEKKASGATGEPTGAVAEDEGGDVAVGECENEEEEEQVLVFESGGDETVEMTVEASGST
jgi:hypothetical protein